MTDLRIAAQQALEALEEHPYDDRHFREECQPAITALKAALEQPEQGPQAWLNGEPLYTHPPREWKGLTVDDGEEP